jgi:hypothetical protein
LEFRPDSLKIALVGSSPVVSDVFADAMFLDEDVSPGLEKDLVGYNFRNAERTLPFALSGSMP